jgi:hypothetical protein
MTVAIMGFVKGHVQYAGTTIPISDVSVNIDNKSSTTNTDGSYRLDSISIGDKVLYASKDGYDPYQTGLTVVQGSNNKDIEMTSAQYTHYLSGTITSAGNLEPLPGVTVTVLNDDGSPSQLQSTTDVNGRYQVTNVPEGLRIVKFQKQNYQTRTVQILISTSNNNYNVQLSNKPGIPSNPNPLDNATDQDLNLTLSWDCSDPNGDELKYDVYFGTSNPPSQLVEQNYTYSNLPTVIFNYANALPRKIINIRLLPATTYYWKIIAKDNFNNITEGPIWNFTTSDKFGTVTDIDGNVYLTIQIGTQLYTPCNRFTQLARFN